MPTRMARSVTRGAAHEISGLACTFQPIAPPRVHAGMSRLIRCVSFLLLIIGLHPLPSLLAADLPTADLILHNGHIVTVDKAFSIAQAVAIRDGKIVAVGKDADVLAAKGDKTQVVDLV